MLRCPPAHLPPGGHHWALRDEGERHGLVQQSVPFAIITSPRWRWLVANREAPAEPRGICTDMKTAIKKDVITPGTLLLKFVLEHEDGTKTQYDRTVRSLQEWDDILVRALAWESPELTGVTGRTVRAFSPGHFGMTTVLGIVNHWSVKHAKELESAFVVELDWSI